MRLGLNVSAGLANSAWTAVVGFIATPFYLRYLGIEAYGLIGFFTTMLVLLQLLDMGLAPTMNREVARHAADGQISGAGNLLRSMESIYWVISITLGAIVFMASGWIGKYWLQASSLPAPEVNRAIALMGVLVLARWPIGLYMGTLLGAQRIVLSSGINIFFTTFSALGSILVLAFVSATIEAFFIWQAVTAFAYVAAVREAAWRALAGRRTARFQKSELLRIWRFSAGLAAVAVSGIVFSQLDKVLLSRMLPLDAFGRYMLACTVSGTLYLLITPVFNAVYPRFSALVASGEIGRLGDIYALGTRFLSTFLFPAAISIAVYARPLIEIWTGNEEIAMRTAPIVSLLVLGGALHGVMYFPYALQLAFGEARLPLTINLILIGLLVPVIVVLTKAFAEIGAAMAWVILHVCYVLLGTWMTHRRLLRGCGTQWLLRDVGIPGAMSLLAAACVSQLFGDGDSVSGMAALLASASMFVACVAASFAASPRLWHAVSRNIRLAMVTGK